MSYAVILWTVYSEVNSTLFNGIYSQLSVQRTTALVKYDRELHSRVPMVQCGCTAHKVSNTEIEQAGIAKPPPEE